MRRQRPSPIRQKPRVALIVETTLASGRAILAGIGRYLWAHGAWSVSLEARELEESPEWLKHWKGDGIIARVRNPSFVTGMAKTGVPVVDVLGDCRDPRFPLIHVDNVSIARLAFDHLYERGFRNFGFVGLRDINWSEQRRAPFAERTAAEHCAFSECILPFTNPLDRPLVDEQEELNAWLKRLPRPTGIMVCNDQWGQLVLESCRQLELAVPEEMAVIAVDNDEPLCAVCNPPLSSVQPRHDEVGYEAAHLLDQLMQGIKPPGEPKLISGGEVVTRRSSDVQAVNDPDVAAALRYIYEYACDGLKVGDVVDYVATSRSTLQRRFADTVGRTIHDEILRVRLDRARQLLTTTPLPISQIARKVGFEHQEYMGSVFRKKLGQTPLQVRRGEAPKRRKTKNSG
jgi:LacI family transcriptional regulator